MHNVYYLGLSGERSLPFELLVMESAALECLKINVSTFSQLY